jgi:hypothetical protein
MGIIRVRDKIFNVVTNKTINVYLNVPVKAMKPDMTKITREKIMATPSTIVNAKERIDSITNKTPKILNIIFIKIAKLFLALNIQSKER